MTTTYGKSAMYRYYFELGAYEFKTISYAVRTLNNLKNYGGTQEQIDGLAAGIQERIEIESILRI